MTEMIEILKDLLLMTAILSTATASAFDLSDDYNLSFEKDDIGYEGVPMRWTFQPSPTVICQITEKCPKGKDAAGNKCLMVDYTKAVPGDKSRFFLSDFMAIDPNCKYTYSFRLKTEGQTDKGFGVSVGTLYFDKNKTAITPKIYDRRYQITNKGNTEWAQYRNELSPAPGMESNDFESSQIPPEAKYVRLMFLSYGYNKKYWIDDFRLEPSRATAGTFAQGDTKIAHAVASKDKVSINGRLSEKIWSDEGNWNSGFIRTVCNESDAQPVPDTGRTRFKVAYDDKNIFLGIACDSPNIDNIRSSRHEHNSMDVFSDEDIEVFIDCSGERKGFYQIAVNPSGSFTELCYGVKHALGLEVATARTASGWTAEISIPRDRLWQLFTEAGSRVDRYLWNINICRHQPGVPDNQCYSAWNFTGNGFGSANAMGIMLFEKNGTVLSSRIDDTCLQIKNLEEANKRLLEKSSVCSIQNEQSKFHEAVKFLKDLKQAIPAETAIPDHILSRYLSEIDAMPGQINKGFQTLKRISLAFPKEREEYGYMIYEVPLLAPNDSDMYPSNGECKRLTIRIAGDEISSKRFSVFSRTELKDVTLKCGMLKNCNGEVIPESKIDLRTLKQWGSSHQADILITDERIKLDGYLEKYAGHTRFVANIPANSTKHFLMQVAVSSDIKPGSYEGFVSIVPAGAKATDLPICVEVLPFKLDRTDRFVGYFFTGVIFQPGGPPVGGQSFYNGLASENSLKEEFKHLADSGFNFIVVGGYANGPFNPDYVLKLLEVAGKAGMKNIALQGAEHFITADAVKKGMRKDSKTYQALEERIAKIAENARKNNIELYIYGADEPNSDIDILRNNIIFEIAKRQGLNTCTAIIFDDIREKVKDLDIVAMNYSAMTTGNSKLLDMVFRKEKLPYKKIICYANMPAAQTPIVRMTFGWYLFKSHMGGNVPWAYYSLWQNWKPFADNGKAEGELGAFNVFPTKDRPISTLKFEAAREGVNDLRYLEMLEKKMASGKDKEKITAYKKELDKMLETFSLLNSKGINSENYLISPQVYDDYRGKLQDMLVELYKDIPRGVK